ncbi:phasin family protein [Nocardia abscessus]|uniref:phasin family protein n=1 Tax=Nocardia abscessus TaxID=120957 RepID=UPI00030DA4FF|nr:phasin family protein [Nocardia abscessus]MCC3333584.1 phasin family protein [Nocardia abscessus]
MPHLPIHPVTGLRALGMSKRGPIWPVLGGSEDAPDAPETPDAPEMTPHGFPKKTPVEDMAPEQQAAYWKYHARKHEGAVKAYGGKTPQQIAELETQLQTLQSERMSAEERAVADAVSQAQEATRAEVAQEWQGKYRTARLEAIAGRILTDEEQLKSFMDIVDTAKFVGEDGEIDAEAVTRHLTTIYGQPRQFGSGLPQHRDWGQHSTRPPGASGIEQGKAAAARRHGTKTT